MFRLLFISTDTPHQSTLSLFTMVKQAHLLSEEQLAQIKESELNEHYKHSYRATLKRSSPSREEFDSPAEKFAKAALDVEIENSSEYGEFFSQEETSDDCKKASRIYADQEVPVQDEDVTSNSTGQAMEVVDERMSGSPVSKKGSSFGEKPSFNSESDDMKWLSSTEDHLHIGNAWLYEAPKKGPCTKSFCLKFFQKHHGHLLNVNSPEKEGLSTYGAAQVSSMNTEQGGGETRLTNQLGKNSELIEREQIMIITDEEDPSHNEVQVVLSQSPVTYNIACEYPPLPENTGLCSSLHAIDERALITCVSIIYLFVRLFIDSANMIPIYLRRLAVTLACHSCLPRETREMFCSSESLTVLSNRILTLLQWQCHIFGNR